MSRNQLHELVTSDALPLNTVSLGRLVNNQKQPWQNFLAFSLIVPTDDDVSNAIFRNVKDNTIDGRSVEVNTWLTSVLTFLFHRNKDVNHKLNTEQCTVRRLLNSEIFFNRLCAQKVVKDWLEECEHKHRKVFLVTGLVTVTDASVNQDSKTTSTFSGALQAPITAVLSHGLSTAVDAAASAAASAAATAAATTAAPDAAPGATPDAPQGPNAAILDPKVATKVKADTQANISFDVPGERIIAVEYREVGFRDPSSRDTKDAQPTLGPNTKWQRRFGATRGKAKEPTGGLDNATPSPKDDFEVFFKDSEEALGGAGAEESLEAAKLETGRK